MSGEQTSRLYRIILLDRTTNPKVNRYLRDLLGITVWQASTLMNMVPSVLLENIPLNDAIDIKTHLGRFGLQSKIELISEDKDQKVALILKEKTPAPAVTTPAMEDISPAEVTPKEEDITSVPQVQAPSIEESQEPAFQAEPPARFSKRKRKKVPLFFLLLPFLILLFIAVFIEILGSRMIKDLFHREGKIVLYEGDTTTVKKMKFVEGDQSPLQRLIARMKKGEHITPEIPAGASTEGIPAESLASGESKASQTPSPGSEAVSLSPAGEESGLSPTTGGAPGISPTGGGTELSPTGGGPGLSPAGSTHPPSTALPTGQKSSPTQIAPVKPLPKSGKVFLAPSSGLGLSTEAGKSPSGTGKSSVKGKSTPPFRPPYEFVGSPEGVGVNSEKLEAFVKDAEKALSQKDSNAVKQDAERLDLAETLAEPQQRNVLDRFNAPAMKDLRQRLDKVASMQELKPGLEFQPELTGAEIRVETNLPDSALLEAKLSLPGRKSALEYTLPVENGAVQLPYSGGLPSGTIGLNLELAPMEEQPPSVLDIIGEQGENLKGEAVKAGGKVQFQGRLSNRVARSRGEVTSENAESAFKRLADAQGLSDFTVSDFHNQNLPENSFVTIAADNVNEEEFVVKACRSAGFLTMEMNEPPQYLRLVVNHHQYFIPTNICRKVLREYREDDPAVLDYLLNYLLAL